MTQARAARYDRRLYEFARLLATGKSPAEAALLVGYGGSSFRSNARKRAQSPLVKAYVEQFQADARERTVITIEKLIGYLQDAREKAMTEKSGASAVIAAAIAMAKLAGLWREKIALTDPSGLGPAVWLVSDEPETPYEWERTRATTMVIPPVLPAPGNVSNRPADRFRHTTGKDTKQ
jgi:hypothetical protein